MSLHFRKWDIAMIAAVLLLAVFVLLLFLPKAENGAYALKTSLFAVWSIDSKLGLNVRFGYTKYTIREPTLFDVGSLKINY